MSILSVRPSGGTSPSTEVFHPCSSHFTDYTVDGIAKLHQLVTIVDLEIAVLNNRG